MLVTAAKRGKGLIQGERTVAVRPRLPCQQDKSHEDVSLHDLFGKV